MVVVDSSVVAKWLLEENESNREIALNILKLFLAGEEKLVAPDIILYELGNILSYKATLDLKEIKKAWKIFLSYKLAILKPDEKLMEQAIELSKKYNVTVYDSYYAVLAKQKRCKFITADEKFVKAVKLSFVKLLSSQDSEEIEAGLQDIKAGRVVSWKEVKKKAGVN